MILIILPINTQKIMYLQLFQLGTEDIVNSVLFLDILDQRMFILRGIYSENNICMPNV